MGWIGKYYSNANFTGLIAERDDGPVIDFATNEPSNVMFGDNRFVVGVNAQWNAKFTAPFTGTFTFYVFSDNNVTVRIDDIVVLDAQNQQVFEFTFTKALQAGQMYDAQINFNDYGFLAKLKFEWQSSLQVRQLIPAALVSLPVKQSPLRYCPPGLLARKNLSEQTVAGILAVKPKSGPWEGFTSWDRNLTLGQYADLMGNVIPALTYRPCGVEMSTLPAQLKLGSQAADVKAFSPSNNNIRAATGLAQIGQLYLDRTKLLKNYYQGAFWAYLEIDPTLPNEYMAWVCGEVGNIQTDDIQSTIELTTYDEMANRKVGQVYHIFCQVGTELRLFGGREEDFGTGRCENQVLHNGPKRDDWTVVCTVKAGSSKTSVILEYSNLARSGVALNGLLHTRIANGALEFLGDPTGGLNSLLKVPARAAELVSTVGTVKTVRVFPKLSLPYTPQIGDQVYLVAGCRRTKTDCLNYANLPNFRGQDLPGNDDLLRRTKV